MNNINKTIKGVSLLTDINLALESGHIYGFVGDNGSGKTVLFKVLFCDGLLRQLRLGHSRSSSCRHSDVCSDDLAARKSVPPRGTTGCIYCSMIWR